jgi:Trk K+ transport system NAD-binding subunit
VTADRPAGSPSTQHTAPSTHVILCGLGNVGRQIALRVHQAGVPVVAIDTGPSAPARRLAASIGARVIVGDARVPEVLREAGLADARAVVIATAEDLVNLEVALVADAEDPDVRIVLRMFNESIARELEGQFSRWKVLSLADLAAPTFVAAALSPDVVRGWRVPAGPKGTLLALAEVTDRDPTRIAEYPEVTPIYLRRLGGDVEFWPPPDGALAPGDRLGVITSVERLREMAGVLRHVQPTPARWLRRMGDWSVRASRAAGTLIRQTEPALLVVLTGVLLFAVLSVAVFSLFWHLSLLDSIYFVTTVMTTTGFGDITLRDAPTALKVYGIILMLAGAGILMPTIYSFIAVYVVSARLRQLFGVVRTDLVDHVIVIGIGTVGFRILDELRALTPNVIGVDQDEASGLVRTAQSAGATVVNADARRVESLQLANAARARTVVIATSDDLANLETALNARQLNPRVHVVLRLFDQGLAERVRRAFQLNASFSAAGLVAPAFAAAALGESALESFRVHGRDLVLGRIDVDGGEPCEGLTVGDLRGRCGAVVLAGADGATTLSPNPEQPLRAGDALYLICDVAEFGRMAARPADAARETSLGARAC